MAIESTIAFSVRCDKCTVPLYAAPYGPPPPPGPATHFPTVLAAIHRALQQHWTIGPATVHCPTCSAALDAEAKDT